MNAAIHLAAQASVALASAIWQGLVMTVCVWVALRLLPQVSAAVRSALWLSVFLLTAALSLLPHQALGAATAAGSGLHVDVRWALTLLCCWGVFSAWSAFRLVRGALQLARIVGAAQPAAAPHGCEELLTGARAATLCVSPAIEVPSVAGFFRPRILLPVGLMEKVSAEDLRQIVLHEMEHLRRYDDWTNLLQKVALMLCPLNPVLVWLERRLCLERELACDDGVLRATDGRAYATCLTNLAEYTMLRRKLSLALGAWQRQSELARRVHRILLQPRASAVRGQRVSVAGAMVVACAAAALALAYTPQIVSFNATAMPSLTVSSPGDSSATVPQPATEHATLVSAKFPIAPAIPSARRPLPARAKLTQTVARVRHRRVLRAGAEIPSQVVLVGWRGAPAIVTQAVYLAPVSVSRAQFTYAAVPVRNGWLILQM